MSLAEFVGLQMIDSTTGSDLTTGATLTVSFNGGAFAAPTNAPAHVVNGWWRIQLTAGERVNSQVDVQGTHASGITQTRTYVDPIEGAALAVNYTAGRAANLDFLDTTIASRSSHSAADAAVATLASQVEVENGGLSLQQVMSLINAVLAGRSTANGLTFLTADGVATRVVATVNASKERLTVAITPSA